jgi:hypothetical protein
MTRQATPERSQQVITLVDLLAFCEGRIDFETLYEQLRVETQNRHEGRLTQRAQAGKHIAVDVRALDTVVMHPEKSVLPSRHPRIHACP